MRFRKTAIAFAFFLAILLLPVKSIYADDIVLTKLGTPENLTITDGVLSWDAVENADTYEVWVGVWKGDEGMEMSEATNQPSLYIRGYCLDLMSQAGYTNPNDLRVIVEVEARPNNTEEFSVSDKAINNYQITDLGISSQLTKLNTPSNFAVVCSTVSWDAVENTDTYTVWVGVWKGDEGVETSKTTRQPSLDIRDTCFELMSYAGYTDSNDLRIVVEVVAKSNNTEVFSASDKGVLNLLFTELSAHAWNTEYTIDVPATEAASGSKSIHCSVCNAVKDGSTEVIPQLPPSTPIVAPAIPQAPAEIQDLPAIKISKPVAAKKSVNVKWKKVSKKNLKKIQGIEIQVATDPGFTDIVKATTAGKKKTSKKIKGLTSKQTYYIRIRAYNNAADGKHVSSWKAKKVKVK